MQAGKGKAGKVVKGSKADLDKRSVGLPTGWRALWDATQKAVYYGNTSTKVCSHAWDIPGSAQVQLSALNRW